MAKKNDVVLDEIDAFLENGKYWSRLMKINEFSSVYEGRLALLKLAYCYGIFSGNISVSSIYSGIG